MRMDKSPKDLNFLDTHNIYGKNYTDTFSLCALMTWWLWQMGTTRFHPELGRETFSR